MSGLDLKDLNGSRLVMDGIYATALPASTQVNLT